MKTLTALVLTASIAAQPLRADVLPQDFVERGVSMYQSMQEYHRPLYQLEYDMRMTVMQDVESIKHDVAQKRGPLQKLTRYAAFRFIPGSRLLTHLSREMNYITAGIAAFSIIPSTQNEAKYASIARALYLNPRSLAAIAIGESTSGITEKIAQELRRRVLVHEDVPDVIREE